MTNLRCLPLTPARLDDYLEFFDDKAFADNPRWAGCYCYFPLHDPDTMDWHARGAAENRAAVVGCVGAGTANGVLAYAGDDVVGWCSAGPWSQYPMLRDYDAGDTSSLGVIFCFVVAPEQRRRGVARALLDAACESLRAVGMTAAQAKPAQEARGAAANHLGPLALYLGAGFSIVGDAGDGDVFVRKSLVGGEPSANGDAAR
jgi:ribosomal protein S18 acetylase RimI-like enzyme